METQLLNSAQQAQAILLAWQHGDLGRFRREVDAATRLIPNHPDSTEMERIELLNGVAGELRFMKQPLTDPDMSFCHDLLQHLASQSIHTTMCGQASLAAY